MLRHARLLRRSTFSRIRWFFLSSHCFPRCFRRPIDPFSGVSGGFPGLRRRRSVRSAAAGWRGADDRFPRRGELGGVCTITDRGGNGAAGRELLICRHFQERRPIRLKRPTLFHFAPGDLS
jgi:hypothetical protein